MAEHGKNELKEELIKANDLLEEYSRKLEAVSNYSSIPHMNFNPFTVTLNDSFITANKKQGESASVGNFNVVDRETGEVLSDVKSNIIFRRKQYVDNQQFIKIYSKSLRDIFDLSYGALKVFFYFMHIMQNSKDSDLVWFDVNECQEFCKYKNHRPVYDNVTELVKKAIICKSDKPHRFWVNPQFVFNGNRIVVFNEFIKKDDDYFKKELK